MSDVLPLESAEHVVVVRQAVRQRAVDLGFSLVDQTKIVTAASELGRNTIQHGGGGRALIEIINDGTRKGLRLTFEDQGPALPTSRCRKSSRARSSWCRRKRPEPRC